MIKVESNMLVLDNSFSKEDVLAIDEFVQIAKEQQRERIIKLIEVWWETDQELEELVDIIRGEK